MLLITCVLTSVSIQQSNIMAQAQDGSYNLHYNAEPANRELRKDLVEADPHDVSVQGIIRYAKETARAAGYPLSGRNLDAYAFEGRQYKVQSETYENRDYYVILLTPENMPETCHTLEVSVRKGDRKIITILQGP